jgi:BirA family biotin operon repressor/biotin-[acetyl-CoA-carboxylase] ligase
MSATTLFTWDGYDATAIAKRLGLANVWMYAETDSTLDLAHAMAEKGVPAGALVVADAQRSGRGRMGRSWSSEPGRGVWCTLVERPRDAKALDVLSIRVGLRLAEALDALAGARVGVKWPNDLVLGGRKLGGILTEARWSGASLAWVAIGVGVNVLAPTGVDGATGLPAGTLRVDALVAIVAAVRSAAAAAGELTRDELARYASRDVLVGRRIVSPVAGTVTGIAASGALMVDTARGVEQHRSGTIELAEAT